jgi:Pyruvate/2-oxoacid:ferredoxin oxidoreductase gamma subunit
MINASDIVKKEGASIVLTNIYMLGFASFKNLIPLEKKYLLQSIEEVVPKKYLDINMKIFESAFKVLEVEETKSD